MRKGDLSKLTIDREFPHQVGIPASEVMALATTRAMTSRMS